MANIMSIPACNAVTIGLREYYGTDGHDDPIHIDLPKGTYDVDFASRTDEPHDAISRSKISGDSNSYGSLRCNIDYR